jgi:hypothetical protein
VHNHLISAGIVTGEGFNVAHGPCRSTIETAQLPPVSMRLGTIPADQIGPRPRLRLTRGSDDRVTAPGLPAVSLRRVRDIAVHDRLPGQAAALASRYVGCLLG